MLHPVVALARHTPSRGERATAAATDSGGIGAAHPTQGAGQDRSRPATAAPPTDTVTLSPPVAAAGASPAATEVPPEQRIPKLLLDFLNLLWGASTSAVSQENLLAAAAHAVSPTPAPSPGHEAQPAPLTYGRAGRPDPAPPPPR